MNYGEIIELGRHRLMCGDATLREDVMKLIGNDTVNLVLTDPPYGIKSVAPYTNRIGGHHSSKITGGKIVKAREYAQVIGDESTETARKNNEILRELTNKQIIWGGNYFTDFLPVSGGWIFWDKEKNTEKLTFSEGELAYCTIGKKVRKYVHKWNGFIRDGDKKLNERVHPNQKPVELHMKILEDFSQSDDVILDCFGGSGTTLIACEMTGRKCLMMEISPEYCDVICERYKKLKEENPLMI